MLRCPFHVPSRSATTPCAWSPATRTACPWRRLPALGAASRSWNMSGSRMVTSTSRRPLPFLLDVRGGSQRLDAQRQSRGVAGAGHRFRVEWTIVRFWHLGRGHGRELRYVGNVGPGTVGVSDTAADIAGFAVSQILDADCICDVPAISNRRPGPLPPPDGNPAGCSRRCGAGPLQAGSGWVTRRSGIVRRCASAQNEATDGVRRRQEMPVGAWPLQQDHVFRGFWACAVL